MSAGLAPREQAVPTIARWRPMEVSASRRPRPRSTGFWYFLGYSHGTWRLSYEILVSRRMVLPPSVRSSPTPWSAVRLSNSKYLSRTAHAKRYLHPASFPVPFWLGHANVPGSSSWGFLAFSISHVPLFPSLLPPSPLSTALEHWDRYEYPPPEGVPNLLSAVPMHPRPPPSLGPRGRWAASSRSW